MAVNSITKAMDLKRDLADNLSKQLYSAMPYRTDGFDSLGNPTVTFSVDATPTATHKVVVITVAPYLNGTALDVFGNTANAYSNPTKIQICTEANYAGTSDNVADILAATDLLPVFAEVARKGTIIEWHQTATSVLPTAAVIVAGASLVATYKPLYWGIQSAV
jgi:hypothetical protein